MASYPSSLKSWTTKYDQGQAPAGSEDEEINFAAHVNEIQDEVGAIQTVLGTNPHGSASTVKARIAAVESGKSDTSHGHDSAYVRRDIATTKGDLLAATGAGSFSRIGVGSTGQVVTPDSGQPAGVRWRTLGHEELANLGGKAHPDLLDEATHTALHPSGVGVKPFVGMIVPSALPTIPAEWLECNGQAVSRTTYSELFNAIGTTFGSGDGSTTFNVPDIRGRFIVGHDPGDTSFDALNEKGGAKTVALTTAEMPTHNHTASSGSAGGHNHGGSSGTVSSWHTHSGTTASQSSSHSHSGNTGYDSHGHTVNSNGSHTHSAPVEGSSVVDHSHSQSAGTHRAGTPQPTGSATTSNSNHSAGSHGHSTSSPSHRHSFGTGSQSSSHNHSFTTGNPSSNHSHSISSDGGHSHSVTVNNTGSGNAHENLPPYIVLKHVIFAGA